MSNANTIEMHIGLNRTGIGLTPQLGKAMLEGSSRNESAVWEQLGQRQIGQVRQDYGVQKEMVGSMPLPTSWKGMAKVALDALKGERSTVFLDRLADRLAFERAGVRLYEAFLNKFDALGTWEGGPSRPEIESIRQDELRHFELLREAIESLGADPTVMTPAADVSGVEAMGVMQVVADPRTTVPQALHALLTIELIDNDSWRMLIDLAKVLGHHDLAARMQSALQDEDRHLGQVRAWLSEEARMAAQRELEPLPQPTS